MYKVKSMGLLEYFTTTTHVLKVVNGVPMALPVTPLMKAAELAGGVVMLAGASAVGKLLSDLTHN